MSNLRFWPWSSLCHFNCWLRRRLQCNNGISSLSYVNLTAKSATGNVVWFRSKTERNWRGEDSASLCVGLFLLTVCRAFSSPCCWFCRDVPRALICPDSSILLSRCRPGCLWRVPLGCQSVPLQTRVSGREGRCGETLHPETTIDSVKQSVPSNQHWFVL